MPNEPIGQLHLVRLRLARLGSTGAPLVGASNGYVSGALQTLTLSPEYTDGEEIEERNGEGTVCVSFKADDTFKWVNFELTICTPDPYLMEMLAGGSILTSGTDIGYAWPALGPVSSPPVSMEAWTKRVNNGALDADKPYEWYAMPRLQKCRLGERTLGNNAVLPTFSGQIVENPNWTPNGPFNDWPTGVPSSRVVQHIPTATIPAASSEYIAIPTQT